jgi:hypothetical protein
MRQRNWLVNACRSPDPSAIAAISRGKVEFLVGPKIPRKASPRGRPRKRHSILFQPLAFFIPVYAIWTFANVGIQMMNFL